MGMRLSLAAVQADTPRRLEGDAGALFRLLTEEGEGHLHLDKEWHGIHFLLTGESCTSAHPLAIAIFGSEDIGEDLSYGPARLLSVDQVHEVASALSKVAAQELRHRYNPKSMTEAKVYPEVWEREGDDALEWLMAGLALLTKFYSEASSQNRAVVLAIL
jgi:Domain of unknown function (DUF1877)